PQVGGIAWNGNCTGPGPFHVADPIEHPGKRISARTRMAGRTIGYARIAPEHGWHMVLVAGRLGKRSKPNHKYSTGHGPHATQHAKKTAGKFSIGHGYANQKFRGSVMQNLGQKLLRPL